MSGQSLEEASISFADGQTRGKGPFRRRWLHTVVEVRVHIVFDVIMKPREDSSRFVCWRGKWRCKLIRQPYQVIRRKRLAGKPSRMGIWS